jgi:DNA-binding MarR family transcriptional regulator
VTSRSRPVRNGNGQSHRRSALLKVQASADLEEVPHSIRDLLAFRIQALGNVWLETSQHFYARRFGLKMSELKVLSTVGGFESISLNRLGRLAGIDNAAASRTVSFLVASGLLSKVTDPTDRRALMVTLSAKGRATYLSIFEEAMQRNAAWLSVLSPNERSVLSDLLDRLTRQARDVAKQERLEGVSWND